MRKFAVTLFFAVISLDSYSQITITSADMPNAGDTPRVSIAQLVPGIDFATTGANQLWDYTALQPASQRVDTFYNVTLMNTNYALFFINLPINPNRATIAARAGFIPAIPSITVTDAFGFGYESTSLFQITGVGATINGFATPIAFNSKDIIYNFPVNFNDTDSCDADFNVSLPGLGYYGYMHHRVNLVDGWGTITTPFGTFNCLRVKSTVAARDSIYSDSLQTGFAQDRPLTTDYKFIANGIGIPVLTISTTMLFGNETIVEVVYPDSVRVLSSVHEPENELAFEIFPNPAHESIVIRYESLKEGNYEIRIVDLFGRLVLESPIMNYESGINLEKIKAGIYFVRITGGKNAAVKKLIISR